MNIQEIEGVFKSHWKQGWGSISARELVYVQELIQRYSPRDFLEIGMASGLSGGLIATLLEENGGGNFTSLDHDNTFFGDSTKENGFLIDEIYKGSSVSIQKLPFKTSLDLAAIDKQYDMAFIDANHQHPWPLLDTLCLFPFLKGSRVVIHHDLNLYKKQKVVYGIGPKYLFDQFPEDRREKYDADGGNIFSIDLNLDTQVLENIAINAFYLPWSLRTPLTDSQLEAFRRALSNHYSDSLLDAFEAAAARFNSSQPGEEAVTSDSGESGSSSWLSRLRILSR